jgi:hypothetical protein
MAGGLKVADEAKGLFYKVALDSAGLYKGSRVMADKAPKHEAAILAQLHPKLPANVFMLPLIMCTDVTLGGGSGRVYRVQAFSKLPVSASTLHIGSDDAGRTVNFSQLLLFHAMLLARVCGIRGTWTPKRSWIVHKNEAADPLPGTESTAALITAGPHIQALLEQLGCHTAAATGKCAALIAKTGMLLHPLQPYRFEASVEIAEATTDPRFLESSLSLLEPLSQLCSDPVDTLIDLPPAQLPFDVELHLCPGGEVALVDAHRLCIPEAFWDLVPSTRQIALVVTSASPTPAVISLAAPPAPTTKHAVAVALAGRAVQLAW